MLNNVGNWRKSLLNYTEILKIATYYSWDINHIFEMKKLFVQKIFHVLGSASKIKFK